MRYIDADKLIGELHSQFLYDGRDRTRVYAKIQEQPTADVQKEIDYWHEKASSYEQTIVKLSNALANVRENVKGEWIKIGEPDKDNNQQVECNRCHAGDLHAVGVEVPYCWKCGADMRGGTNERE